MSKAAPSGNKFLALKMFSFLVVVCGFFTAVGFYFPQKESAPPKALNYKTLTSMDELVNHGRELAFSPGMGCASCHGIGDPSKNRCPDWDGMGARAGSQEPGKDSTTYLHEAIVAPSAFLVAGFDDIMKVPPIPDQRDVYAMVAFLQSLGGTPDPEILAKVKEMPEPEKKKTKPIWELTAEEHGEKILKEYGGCATCHAIGNDDAADKPTVGPSLTGFAKGSHPDPDNPDKQIKNNYAYLYDSIRYPDKVIAKGCGGVSDGPCFPGIMPKTFNDPEEATYMSDSYIRHIAAYLWDLAGEKFDPVDAVGPETSMKPKPKSKALSERVPVKWTPEAVALLNERPPFARPMISSAVERYARQQGLRLVTPALYEEARSDKKPPFAKMMGGDQP